MVLRSVLLLLVLSPLSGCSSNTPGAPPPGDGGTTRPHVDGGADAGPDAGRVAPPRRDGGAPPPPVLGRGGRWVRSHPMFLSALTVSMGVPTEPFVRAYFDDFGADAIELWQDGVPNELDGWHAQRPGAPFVSWLRRDGTSQDGGAVLGGYAPDAPGRIGYQVGDEPRTLADYLEIEDGLRAVHAADPEALTIVNFSFLATGLDELVDRYCASGLGDIISYDRYSRSRSAYGTLAYFRDAGMRCHLPYWRYVKAYISGPDDDLQSRSDLRWDAFVGLLYGYTGHTWFIYQVAPAHMLTPTLFDVAGSFDASPTARFDLVSRINREMLAYGRTLTQLTSTDVRYVAAVAGSEPAGAPPWSIGAGSDPYLSGVEALDGAPLQDVLIGYFRSDGGDTYTMVMNPNHSHGSIPTHTADAATIRLRFDFGGASGVDGTHLQALDAPTGTLVDLPILGGGGGPHADLRIGAGDVILYKYATGAPFAGY